ncbi:hypothetical protein Tco_0895114 [Tanacetum coccineum]|uniref:Uncharacterized protein n=1 Tax=Tanacetum coccineum TaxID=301880 RepID=A0ABQ5CF59_9ASTR
MNHQLFNNNLPTLSTQLDSGLVLPSFLPNDDPIGSLNKAMMTQTTIQDGRVIVQNVQGQQSQGYVVILLKRATRLLADELEEFDSDCDDLQLNTTSIFKAYHVDAFDSDCDEAPTASAIFMVRFSPAGSVNGDDVGPSYDSDILSHVPHYDTYHEIDMLNLVVQEMEYSEYLVSNNDSYTEPTGDNNVISYADYITTIKNDVVQSLPPPEQDNAMILSVIEQMQSQVE